MLNQGESLFIKIKDKEPSEAKIINSSQVQFDAKLMSFNEWGKRATGWSAINIYDWAKNVKGETIGDLRLQLSETTEKQSSGDLTPELDSAETNAVMPILTVGEDIPVKPYG